jgi:hypothetical protein
MSFTLPKNVQLPFYALLLTIAPSLSKAQCTSSGPLSAGTSASVSFGGSDFNFSNPANIFSSDNNRASSTGLITLFNGETEYLQATNFGFAIPSTAIICGIVVEAEKSAVGIGTVLGIGLSFVSDYSVRLVRNGVVTGNNKASASHWTTAENYHSYGGSNDIWGVAWTPADINSSNFGIAFSANINGLAMLIPNVRIDHIRITVYYMLTILPLNLLNFTVTVNENNSALMEWETPADKNHIAWLPQRSRDGKQWENIDGNIQQTYQPGKLIYRLEDRQPHTGQSFYRLKLTSASSEFSYSAVRTIRIGNTNRLKTYPNPFTDRIVISGNDQKEKIILTDLNGRLIQLPQNFSNTLNLQFLLPGSYLLHIGSKVIKLQKQPQ